jgi:hypothetical protein
MGCGETLSVMGGGHVTCRKLECPRPDAVSEILADRETEHLVTFSPTAFTVRHPLRERLDDALMDCELHEFIAALDGPPVLPGLYRALESEDDGGWVWRSAS